MRTLGVAIASLVLLMQALAGEHARLPDESLRRIFSESRKMLNGQGDLKSIGVERIVRTELGAPIAKAVDMESSDLKITLDSSSGRILAIERRPKRPRYTIDDAGSVAVIVAAGVKVPDFASESIPCGFIRHSGSDSFGPRW